MGWSQLRPANAVIVCRAENQLRVGHSPIAHMALATGSRVGALKSGMSSPSLGRRGHQGHTTGHLEAHPQRASVLAGHSYLLVALPHAQHALDDGAHQLAFRAF